MPVKRMLALHRPIQCYVASVPVAMELEKPSRRPIYLTIVTVLIGLVLSALFSSRRMIFG